MLLGAKGDLIRSRLLFQMNPMKKTMCPWGQNGSDYSDEHQTAEERVKRREQLRRCCFHPVDRAHAAEDHGGIKERIDPIQPCSRVVARGSETHGEQKDQKCQEQVAPNSP